MDRAEMTGGRPRPFRARWKPRLSWLPVTLLVFSAGFACGGYTFIDTHARPVAALRDCTYTPCRPDSELLALITSAYVHVAPGLLPNVIARSPECVGIVNPRPTAITDLVFFPRRDIEDLLNVSPADEPYVFGCFALMRQVAERRNLKSWYVKVNGPSYREIAYLHFHLLSD